MSVPSTVSPNDIEHSLVAVRDLRVVQLSPVRTLVEVPRHLLPNAVNKDREEAPLAIILRHQGKRIAIELIFKATVV